MSPIKNSQNGFTLIELLISITLLSALLFTGTYAYSLMSGRWQTVLNSFQQKQALHKNIILLDRLLTGIIPYTIYHKDSPAFFFIGGKDSLLAVSNTGFTQNNHGEIFRLSVVENKNGLKDLVLQTQSLNDFLLINSEQEILFTENIYVLKNIQQFSLTYFGGKSYKNKVLSNEESETKEVKEWFDTYSGIDRQLVPERMQIQIRKNDKNTTFIYLFDKKSSNYIIFNQIDDV